MANISWTRPMLERFIDKYNTVAAQTPIPETFEFEGNTFVFRYAFYLIEYLKTRLK